MTNGIIKRDNWVGGANNRADRARLPEGFYREAVNLDPVPGGTLAQRAGYRKALEGTAIRGAISLGARMLIADGTNLIEMDLRTNTSRTLRTIAGAGALAGVEHNGELFFCTANEALRYDGTEVREWGVQSVIAQPPAAVSTGGALTAGNYQYAITFTDVHGDEGGTLHAGLATLEEDEGRITVMLPTPPAGGIVNLYASYHNAATLYWQGAATSAGAFTIAVLRDDSKTLGTQFMDRPAVGDLIESHNGVILVAVGNVLHLTAPMRPHLRRPAIDFLQYPKPITLIKSVPGGVFVCADATYFITDLETQPAQRKKHASIAVRGTGITLPNKTVAWMTEYGQAIGAEDGSITLLTADHYVPDITDRGAAALLEHNGNQLAITTMRGLPQGSRLAASDFFSGEVIYP